MLDLSDKFVVFFFSSSLNQSIAFAQMISVHGIYSCTHDFHLIGECLDVCFGALLLL